MNQTRPLSQRIDRATVARVVHAFYRRVLDERGLAPYFAHIKNWPEHESHITDFWWGLMGGRVAQPRPNAMEAGHRELHFGPGELALWLALFEQSLQQELPAETAEQWTLLARRLGQRMSEHGLVRGTHRNP